MKLQEVEKLAVEVCMKQNGHIPQLIMCGKKGNSIIVLSNFPTDSKEKMKIMTEAGVKTAIFEKDKIGELEKVFFISEMWYSVQKKNIMSFIAPSKDPQKKEVLLISELNVLDDREKVSYFNIKRKENNRITNIQKIGITPVKQNLTF